MKVRLISHLLLPRRTAPEGVGALRGGAATVKHVRRSKSPFSWPVTSIIRPPWAPLSAVARVAAVKRWPGVMRGAVRGVMPCSALVVAGAAAGQPRPPETARPDCLRGRRSTCGCTKRSARSAPRPESNSPSQRIVQCSSGRSGSCFSGPGRRSSPLFGAECETHISARLTDHSPTGRPGGRRAGMHESGQHVLQ